MMKSELLIIISFIFLSCSSDKSAKQVPAKIPLESKDKVESVKEIKRNLPLDEPERKFLGRPLYEFYRNKEKQIVELGWTDEPPGVLSSVLFILDGKKYYQIGLEEVPEKYRFNRVQKWKMSQVGSSKIEYITFMNGDTVISHIEK